MMPGSTINTITSCRINKICVTCRFWPANFINATMVEKPIAATNMVAMPFRLSGMAKNRVFKVLIVMGASDYCSIVFNIQKFTSKRVNHEPPLMRRELAGRALARIAGRKKTLFVRRYNIVRVRSFLQAIRGINFICLQKAHILRNTVKSLKHDML